MQQNGRRILFLTLLLSYLFVHGANEITPQDVAATRSIATSLIQTSTATCQSRTVNYITHTLPQQCLRSSWSAPGSAASPTDTGASTPSDPVPAETTPSPASTVHSSAPVNETHTGASTLTGEPTPTTTASDILISSPALTTSASVTPSSPPTNSNSAPVETDLEPDSPLDNASFLSFEEWKKQNLARAGQSPEDVGQGRSSSGGSESRRRPGNINNALDSLGEDTEIELDFSGFGGSDGRTEESALRFSKTAKGPSGSEDVKNAAETVPADSRLRSKDAGKTCKERFNYASFDCAATVLKTNPQCKSSSSVLVENKDSYMLNECAAGNKFIIVELCDDILVDTVVLANFEFFSSMFRTFRVSVSDRYPVKLDRWKILGEFEARNSREIQAFLIENPLIWARYVRIEFLSHYGSEFYCPVSLLRVHGTTMMEEFRHQEELARGEDDLDEDVAEEMTGKALEIPPSVLASQQPSLRDEKAPPLSESKEEETANDVESRTNSNTLHEHQTPNSSTVAFTEKQVQTNVPGTKTQLPKQSPPARTQDIVFERDEPSAQSNATTTAAGGQDSAVETPSSGSQANGTATSNVTGYAPTISIPGPPQTVNTTAMSASCNASDATARSAAPTTTSHDDTRTTSVPPAATASPSSKTSQQVVQDNHRQASSATQPQPSNPPTQESFFKSLHKRLQMLEANSTLSLQYIEEQSRILRDAFTKVEKRQLAKTDKFLGHLNSTVMAELKGFRQQYDQLWQSTVIELEDHREIYQREMLAISARLTILADELVFQKRMAVVQSTLLLLCLGLVLFVRSGVSHLELPLVQQMMNKSQTTLRLQFESPADSPSPPRQGRRSFRELSGLRSSSSHLSDGSPDGRSSTLLEYTPPTPTSGGEDDRPGSEESPRPVEPDDDDQTLKPLPDAPIRGTQSGPATPRGTRESPLDWDQVAEVTVQGESTPGSLGRRSPQTDEEAANGRGGRW